jgi:predicted metal-dependent hydrolase
MKNEPSLAARATIGQYLPEELIDLFCRGIEEFNQLQFYECHETLEAVWQKQIGPEREMTQGIIQIAVALYHLGRKNEVGAVKLLERGVGRVERFEDRKVGLRISDFSQSARKLLHQIGDKALASTERTAFLEITFL